METLREASPAICAAGLAARPRKDDIGRRRGHSRGVDGAFQVVEDKGDSMAGPVVTIYTKFLCGYCHRAKRLLESKGVNYTEHDITMGGSARAEMLARAPGARTVPQIFIGDTHIGGFDDLAALEREGRLDALLTG